MLGGLIWHLLFMDGEFNILLNMLGVLWYSDVDSILLLMFFFDTMLLFFYFFILWSLLTYACTCPLVKY